MAVSTTQSIWRSGGGDQTRAAYCGSGVMAAQFYIADASISGNVKVSSVANAPALLLPAGAVVTQIIINDATTAGTIDMGFTPVGGSASPESLLNNAGGSASTITLGGAGSGTGMGSVMSATVNVNITSRDNSTTATGTVGGVILYYVADPLAGQQSA
jgi:hypothetical protein